jgi:hypothetical protein
MLPAEVIDFLFRLSHPIASMLTTLAAYPQSLIAPMIYSFADRTLVLGYMIMTEYFGSQVIAADCIFLTHVKR